MSVPLCLRGRFTVTNFNGNEYTTDITDIVPQRYSSPSGEQTYTGSNIQSGMYASTSSDGRIFRIKSVGTREEESLTSAILEDIEGLNKKFDSNGNQVGNPENGGGYIFQLNSEGLPMLTNISDPLSPQFTDSLMGRFLYEKKPMMTENFCVLTGGGTNTLAVTYDGKTIIGLGKSIFSTVGNSVAYNGKLWVAVGSGGTAIASSTDGLNWVARVSPLSVGRSVAWNGKLWVVVGSGNATIVTSVDGTTWTSRGKPIATDGYAIVWDGTKFLAGGTGTSSTNKLIESYDGITWAGILFTPLSEIYTLASNGYIWLVGGRQATVTIFTNTLCFSEDGGYSWSNVSSNYPGGEGGVVLSKETRNIAWNGSLWIAVGDGISRTEQEIDGFIELVDTPRAIATSNDGMNWTGQLNNYFPTSGAYGVEWNGSQWFVGGAGPTTSLITSTNGTTWSDQKNLIFTMGKNLSSRKIPFVQQPLTQVRSIQLFARGTGRNVTDPNNGGEPYARRVVLNGTIISEQSGDTTKRGLYLTILNATNFSHVSTTQYNTAGTTNADSDNLGNALNLMTRQQIGILTSYREWESKIATSILTKAALRLGLTKLATFTNTLDQGRPYAAIFYGGGLDLTTGTHDVIERMESNDPDAPLATIAATLITDGNFVSIVGANSTNALYSANSGVKDPVVVITSNDKMGLGTTDPLGKLTIRGIGDETSAIVMLNGSSNGQTRTITGGVISNEIIGLGDIFTSKNRDATDAGQLRLSAGGGTNAGTKSYVDMYGYADPSPTQVGFYVAIGTRGTERLRIDQDGNVGIGKIPDTVLPVANQLKLDVNGHIRGKGSIVNTVVLKPENNNNWTAYSEGGANPINYTYEPIQSGAVNLVVHVGLQMALLSGYGTDDIGADVFATREVPIVKILKEGGNIRIVTNIKNLDSFNALDITIARSGNIGNTADVNTQITIPPNCGTGNTGTFNIISTGFYNGIGATFPAITGYSILVANSSGTPFTPISKTVTLRTGTLKRFHAQYVSGNSWDSSYLNLPRRNWFDDFTMQDAVHLTTSVPTTFVTNVQYGSGDRTFFDIPAYRNTYMVIHEISNS